MQLRFLGSGDAFAAAGAITPAFSSRQHHAVPDRLRRIVADRPQRFGIDPNSIDTMLGGHLHGIISAACRSSCWTAIS